MLEGEEGKTAASIIFPLGSTHVQLPVVDPGAVPGSGESKPLESIVGQQGLALPGLSIYDFSLVESNFPEYVC